MPPKRKPQAERDQKPDLETNISPDGLPGNDGPVVEPPEATPSDSIPSRNPVREKHAVGGGFTPAEDGGIEEHPIHDADEEDKTAGDYEREIEQLEAARSKSI